MFSLPDLGAFHHVCSQTRVAVIVWLLASCVQFSNTISTTDLNLALNKTAYQQSTFFYFGITLSANRAVDGGRNPVMKDGSCSHTKKADLAWWMVDLGEARLVRAVEITNRDKFHARLKDFKIETATTGSQNGLLVDPKLCHFVVGTQGRAATVRYPCPRPIMARFVKVSLTALERLQLCEVAVIGTETQKMYILEQQSNKKSMGTVLFSGHFQSVSLCVARCIQTQSCTSLNILPVPGRRLLCELMANMTSRDNPVDATGWAQYHLP